MKKILGQKKFESEKILGLKKFWLKKNWVQKYCLVRKIQVPKNFWVKKNFGSIKIEPEKYFESKTFGPPQSLRHMVKYGGLNRKTGVGMGVPFLGFRVAYIPNLSLLQSLEPFEKGSKIIYPPWGIGLC